MYPQLLAHFKRYVSLSPQEEQIICENLELVTLKRREHLLEAGAHCKGDYFVLTGCLRQYFVNNKQNEQIINFALENWWIADQESLLTGSPATSYIQAVEASHVLLLSKKNKERLFVDIPHLESYFLIITQKALVAAQRRIGFIFTQTEEERYRQFSTLFPDFLQRVPQYMLASYLGFTPQFMSRLRAKKV